MEMKFKQGDKVYSELGQAAEYVAKIAEGHIVRPEVEAYNGDEEYTHLCDPVTWRAVFEKPPIDKYSAELKSLLDQIKKARETRKKDDEAYRQHERERTAKFKQTQILDGIEAFIDGRITHYVEHQMYGPSHVISVADAMSRGDSGSYRKSLRLLTLGGSLREDKSVSWIINEYSDGSGCGKGVQPCTSIEEAEAIVRKQIANHFANKNSETRESWIEAADKYGIEVPDSCRIKIAKEKLAQLENGNVNYARKQADDYAKAVKKYDEDAAKLRKYLESKGALA